MKIHTLIRNGYQLQPIEVEISFVPGIPKIHFLGQPDTVIKESELRIKSAIKHQGFHFPKGKQVIVNLKPSYLKKTSQGIDLAVACGILIKTEQLELKLENQENLYIYGVLDLHGHVEVPDDMEALLQILDGPLVSGAPETNYSHNIWGMSELKNMSDLIFFPSSEAQRVKNPPEVDEHFKVSSDVATVMSVIAHGEHSALLAGPAGSGKTTFAKKLYSVMPAPDERKYRVSQQINKILGHKIHWRPFIQPHHTITPLAMVGGGVPIFPGEMTRAHGGVLLLDELLEFKREVKEALREPMESGEIHITRQGKTAQLPADFVLMATTNLCPCGDLVPGKMGSCRFSLRKCRSYSEKLSGPMLDRFQVLAFSHSWRNKTEKVTLMEVKKQVDRAREFQQNRRQQKGVNAKISSDKIEKLIVDNKHLKIVLPEIQGSYRRKLALLKVARSLADLEGKVEIQPQHIQQSMWMTLSPFSQMKNIFG